jgi:hypothetical protein
VFVSDLYSTYERKDVAFGLLNLADFIYDDVLQFHPFAYKQKNSFFFMAE